LPSIGHIIPARRKGVYEAVIPSVTDNPAKSRTKSLRISQFAFARLKNNSALLEETTSRYLFRSTACGG
jgi:hypothetical protein